MGWIGGLLIPQPGHILGVALALFLLWAAIRPHRPSMLMAALACLGHAAWEYQVLVSTPEADIRVDLLLLWPLLAVLTYWSFLDLVHY